jgi:hypothetical protein
MGEEQREEELEKQIEALKSGKFKWIKPGGFIDMTKSRIKELTKQLDRLKSKKAGERSRGLE